MDPRTRTRSSLYECAQGSSLYTAPRKNINPSTRGDHIQEEIAEVSKWVNQHLASAGHTDQLITDLAIDMADGITLLQLVQALSKEDLPKHFPNPIMRVQKLENLQICVRALQDKGIPMKGIHADDIAGGNVKSILAVCHALKRFFSTSISPKASLSNGSASGDATPTSSPPPPPPPASSSSGQGHLRFSSLDREDMALLGWLGDIVHRDISNYSMLYDGKALCDFANEIKSGAISEQDIISGSPQQRLQIAFTAIESILYVRPTDINISRIGAGKEDVKIRHYLSSCRSVYRQKVARRQTGGAKTDHRQRVSERRLTSDMSRQEVFESLRNSSGSRVGSLEQKEKAKVEARSLEGIRQQQRLSSGGHHQQADGQKEQASSRERGKEKVTPSDSHSTSTSPSHLSSSTNNLFSASTVASKPSTISRGNRGTLHSSHDRLPPVSRRTLQNLPPSRPFSKIYVSRDPSFSLSGGTTQKQRESLRLNQSTEPLASPENWELGQERLKQDTSLSLSQPDDSALTTSAHPPHSYLLPSQAALSRSVEHSLGTPPLQISAPTSGSVDLSGRKSGFGIGTSKSSPQRSSVGGSSSTLPRTEKQSFSTSSPPLSSPLSSPSSPTPPPLPVVPPPSSMALVNQPTFIAPGGRFSRKLPTYPVPENESFASQISDLQDRIALLSNQLLYEKADVYTRLHRAVIRERKRRQATEKRLKELEKHAQQLVRHYDNCFVQLAKEVGSLRQEVARGNRTGGEADKNRSGTGLGNRLYITREIDQLKEQVTKLTGKLDIHSSHSSLPGSMETPPESLFMRKRANSESSLHGPYMRGSALSFKKLSKFFGEEPPRVENIETFLEGLGYSHLYPTFSVHQISLAELYQMDVSHLEVLGIPLGPRVRIMTELRKLEPLGKH